MQSLIPEFEWCLEAAIETTRWVATFDMPDFDRDFQLVALHHDHEYPMNEGRIVTSDGESIEIPDYGQEFVEHHVPHSTALHSVRKKTNASYLCGPLARVNLNFEQLSATARRVADELGIDWPAMNPFQAIVARGLELIHVCEEALSILRNYQPVKPARIAYEYQAGSGASATEAPRGLLYHQYEIEADGTVSKARIIPPTSQNQAQIEADLRAWLPQVLDGDDDLTAQQCEKLVRCYDPCISCSTHFLKVKIDRL
jgi:coenzyme F420-reducing hydrogenase alpha subunit